MAKQHRWCCIAMPILVIRSLLNPMAPSRIGDPILQGARCLSGPEKEGHTTRKSEEHRVVNSHIFPMENHHFFVRGKTHYFDGNFPYNYIQLHYVFAFV